METLHRVEWKDIEIGEVFATKGCWEIFCKETENTALFLASDQDIYDDELGTSIPEDELCEEYYKLPQTVQSYWKS